MMRTSVTRSLVLSALLWGLAAAPASAACADADTPLTADTRAAVSAAVLCLVDEERAKRGLRPYVRVALLSVEAQEHATAIGEGREPFEHADKRGVGPDRRAAAKGYRGFAGENLAGAGSAREAVELLMSDPPHRDSLIDRDLWDDIGAGASPGPDYGTVSIVLGDRGSAGVPASPPRRRRRGHPRGMGRRTRAQARRRRLGAASRTRSAPIAPGRVCGPTTTRRGSCGCASGLSRGP